MGKHNEYFVVPRENETLGRLNCLMPSVLARLRIVRKRRSGLLRNFRRKASFTSRNQTESLCTSSHKSFRRACGPNRSKSPWMIGEQEITPLMSAAGRAAGAA